MTTDEYIKAIVDTATFLDSGSAKLTVEIMSGPAGNTMYVSAGKSRFALPASDLAKLMKHLTNIAYLLQERQKQHALSKVA